MEELAILNIFLKLEKNQQPFTRKNLWLFLNLRDSPLTHTIRAWGQTFSYRRSFCVIHCL